jgi:hypothetical protein
MVVRESHMFVHGKCGRAVCIQRCVWASRVVDMTRGMAECFSGPWTVSGGLAFVCASVWCICVVCLFGAFAGYFSLFVRVRICVVLCASAVHMPVHVRNCDSVWLNVHVFGASQAQAVCACASVCA